MLGSELLLQSGDAFQDVIQSQKGLTSGDSRPQGTNRPGFCQDVCNFLYGLLISKYHVLPSPFLRDGAIETAAFTPSRDEEHQSRALPADPAAGREIIVYR